MQPLVIHQGPGLPDILINGHVAVAIGAIVFAIIVAFIASLPPVDNHRPRR